MNKIKLFDYQQQQVTEALEQRKVLNQSGVGTGKTFVGLEVFKQSKYTRLLVVCLAGKVADFGEDGKKVGLNITPLNKGTAKNKKLLKEAEHVSISFESLWRLTELVQWTNKDTMIIVDESHKLKSPSSKVGAFAQRLSKRSGFVYLMSATLVSNGKYEDLYQQLAIAKLYEGTFKDFKEEYCIEELTSMSVGGQKRYFNVINGYKNTDKLERIVKDFSVFKERDKGDLLPEDIFYYVKKPVMYGKLLKNRVIDYGTHIEEYDNLPKLRHGLIQLASGCLKGVDKPIKKDKLERVQQILESAEGKKAIIFYNYDSELFHLKALMDSMKRPYSEYNGHSHDLSTYHNNTDGVTLVHYKSGSTGKNDFIESNICIFFSSTDSSSTYIQARGRIDRIGTTAKPVYYHLICEKSIEAEMFEVVQSGKDFTDDMLKALL